MVTDPGNSVSQVEDWLESALDYIPQWLEYQMRETEHPGCVLVLVHDGRVVLERAFGHADIVRRVPMTPRHRFRVASHSKTFSAAGILKLREQRKLSLDDRAGQYVEGLHPAIVEATIAQLLSHSAGIIRDGTDSGQWRDARPFLDETELRADLAAAPTIDANTRFKYSNHAFGLIGLLIEAVPGSPYRDWIRRAIIEPAGLDETEPDMPLAAAVPTASGHSSKLPLGRRVVIPGGNPTNALAAATGFVSTARDLAHFFAQLDPPPRRACCRPPAGMRWCVRSGAIRIPMSNVITDSAFPAARSRNGLGLVMAGRFRDSPAAPPRCQTGLSPRRSSSMRWRDRPISGSTAYCTS
jgi:D-alanyl-D-alanine carboxypeptidase